MPYSRPVPVRRSRPEPDSAQIELARLKLAHAQLLRYAQDLKLAYEAERARRTELAQMTRELVIALSVVPAAAAAASRQEAAASVDDLAA